MIFVPAGKGGVLAAWVPRRGRVAAWRKIILTAFLLCLAVGGAMVGCDRDEKGEEIVLRVSNWGGVMVEPDFMRIEREIREGFERQHPGVRVQFEQIPGVGQYAPKLLMMHLTGSVPDVMQLDCSCSAVFIDNGVLRDLMPFIQRDRGFDLNGYYESVLSITRRGDKLYAIPLDFTPMVMFYNRKLFDTAGVPYPKAGWTWGEFLETAKKLTVLDPKTKAPTQYGMNFENESPWWFMMLWTNGGEVLDPAGKRATGYLDSPKSIEAVQFLVDLIRRYHVAPSPKEAAMAGMNLFLGGKAGMDIRGHWRMLEYRANGIDFGAVSLPTNIGRRVTVSYASGLSMMTKAKHPDLAWEYIKYMTSEEVQVKRVSSGLAISGNKAAAAHYAEAPAGADAQTLRSVEVEKQLIAEVPFARPPYGATVERYPVVQDLLRDMMEDILSSEEKLPVEQAVRETAKLIDAALAD